MRRSYDDEMKKEGGLKGKFGKYTVETQSFLRLFYPALQSVKSTLT